MIYWWWPGTVPLCWHVLSWQGVRKAIGYLSIWRPRSLSQRPTTSLVTSAEHINQLTVTGRPDSDRSGMQKRLPGHHSCISFPTFSLWGRCFVLVFSSYCIQNLDRKVCVSEDVFLSRLPTLPTLLPANKGGSSLDIWLTDRPPHP